MNKARETKTYPTRTGARARRTVEKCHNWKVCRDWDKRDCPNCPHWKARKKTALGEYLKNN